MPKTEILLKANIKGYRLLKAQGCSAEQLNTVLSEEELLSALRNEDINVCWEAAMALGARVVEAYALLTWAARNSYHLDKQVKSIVALEGSTTAGTKETLLEIMSHPNPLHRIAAIQAYPWVDDAGNLDREVLEIFHILLYLDHRPSVQIALAAKVAGSTDSFVLGALLKLSDDPDLTCQTAAYQALSKSVQGNQGREKFLNLLGVVDLQYKIKIVRVLRDHLSEEVVKALLSILLEDSNNANWLRAEAALSLSGETDLLLKEREQALITALHTGHSTVRAAAATSLGELKTKTAAEALVLALDDSDWEVSESVFEALTKLPLELYSDFLQKFLKP